MRSLRETGKQANPDKSYQLEVKVASLLNLWQIFVHFSRRFILDIPHFIDKQSGESIMMDRL
jgi:hypothetical protein